MTARACRAAEELLRRQKVTLRAGHDLVQKLTAPPEYSGVCLLIDLLRPLRADFKTIRRVTRKR